MISRLHVWWHDTLVGTLDRGGDGRMYFGYDDAWLARGDARAISRSLPLGEDLFAEVGHAFFANLLPEGAAREAVARALGVHVDSDFALLEALGGDIAGALVLTATDAPPGTDDEAWESIDADDLARWSRGTPALPSSVRDGVRLSVAGAQHKIAARRLADGRWAQTRGSGATTHLLKFCPRDLSHVPANEFLTMRLAAHLGLTTVEVELDTTWPEPVLVVRRYDRHEVDGQVRRLHQEDLCQALGRSRLDKYDLSLRSMLDAIRDASTRPAIDARDLLRWQMFNVLCGNDDGHAKNLSLLREPSVTLAPAYDLVCTAAIDRLSRTLSVPIGGQRHAGNLAASHWRREEQDLGVRKGALTRLAAELHEALPGALDAACADLAAVASGSPALERVPQAVRRRARSVWQAMQGS